jgi:hypothetical protein
MDLFLLTLSGDGRNEESYACKLSSCANPYCACSDMLMILAPCSESAKASCSDQKPVRVTLNPFDRSLVPLEDERSDARHAELGDAITSELTAEQWKLLEDAFLKCKHEAMRSLDPEQEPPPFEFEAIETVVQLVPYQEVFPFAEAILLEHGGRSFVVDDHYCVRPDCECAEVLLVFCPVEADKDSLTPLYAVFRDLRTGTWTEEGTERPPQGEAAELGLVLENSRADLTEVLGERRALLRRVYAASRRQLYRRPAAREATPGRNDPCRCGSGKKYKRCCGV